MTSKAREALDQARIAIQIVAQKPLTKGMCRNGPRGFSDSRPRGEVWVTVDCDGIPVAVGLEESEEREEASGVPGARVFCYVPATSQGSK